MQPRPPATLTIIIVNYESWMETLRLTASLIAEPEFKTRQCEIVVVDNASRDNPPGALNTPFPGLRLVLRPHNDGFAAGVNAGWRAARSSPWLLILNPDVDVPQGFLGQVLARIDSHRDDPAGVPGVVGFALRNLDNTPQGSVGAFPSLARTIWEQFIPRSRRKYQADWRIRSGTVDWVTGACMLINAELLRAVGGMDEDFFLYYEEVAFCRAARNLRWNTRFDTNITVTHRHPLQNRAVSPKMRVITRHSKLLYFHKHLPRWQFQGLSLIVAAEAMIRGTWSRIRRRPQETRAWMAIGKLPRLMRQGQEPRGRDVLAFAEAAIHAEASRRQAAVYPTSGESAANQRDRGPSITAPLRTRKGLRRDHGTAKEAPQKGSA